MATRTISVAGGNWDNVNTWDEGSVPINGDAVVARGGGDSGNVTINVNSACTTIILTNYAGILTFDATLTVAGTVTFVSGMGTIAGTSDLICTGTATLTSGGKVLTGGLQLGGTSQTFTLGDNWSVTGVLNFNGTTGTVITGTAKTITVAGGLTVGVNATTATTPTIIMTDGAWTGAGILRINLTLQGGTITFANGTNYFDTRTLLYSSGTIVVTGNTLQVAVATTLNISFHLNNLTITTSVAIYIPSLFYVDGTLLLSAGGATFSNNGCAMVVGALTTSGAGGNIVFPGNVVVSGAVTLGAPCLFYGGTSAAYTIQVGSLTINAAGSYQIRESDWTVTGSTTISANITFSTGGAHLPIFTTAGLTHSTYTLSGSATFTINGGTWSGTGTFSNYVVLAGTITIGSGTRYCGSLTYTTGTITLTGVTLSIGASATFSTDPLVWENIILAAALTLTINSLLSVSGTLTLPNAAVTFAGTAGFTVGTLTNTTITATRIFTFANGKTYTITGAFTTVHAAAQTVRFTFTSDHASIKAIIILGPSATQNIGFLDPTRIDSSLGQQIFTYKGTINTCLNWISAYPVNIALNDPQLCIGI